MFGLIWLVCCDLDLVGFVFVMLWFAVCGWVGGVALADSSVARLGFIWCFALWVVLYCLLDCIDGMFVCGLLFDLL